ncbi:MAG: TraR/DksA family transcriptional regulator [Planctomycetaceae bacterium]|nr:TraR/DksA family transcriptional regulator [Planctomycetaceae bacterium]
MSAKSLTQEELLRYKQMLLFMRAKLRNEVIEMSGNALSRSRTESSGDLSSIPLHLADVGTDNYEQEFTLSLVQNSSGTLQEIDAALERINEGTYGQCENCECRIPKARLKAIPYTALCVNCAAEKEQEKRW